MEDPRELCYTRPRERLIKYSWKEEAAIQSSGRFSRRHQDDNRTRH